MVKLAMLIIRSSSLDKERMLPPATRLAWYSARIVESSSLLIGTDKRSNFLIVSVCNSVWMAANQLLLAKVFGIDRMCVIKSVHNVLKADSVAVKINWQ